MSSASLQPSVIDDYLHRELAKGRIAGPVSSPLLPHLHISRFGVIPKRHQPGKWCLILNLSSPDGRSVNDGIRKDPFTVQLMKVDGTIDRLCHSVGALCLRSLMWKVPTALFPYTLMIFIFLACSGKEITLWTSPYLLVCLQRLRFFLQLQTWWNGFSKNSMTWGFSFIIWTISTPWVLLILRRANGT